VQNRAINFEQARRSGEKWRETLDQKFQFGRFRSRKNIARKSVKQQYFATIARA